MAYDANVPADSLAIPDIPEAIRQKGADLKAIIDALDASDIANTPAGNIIATTVQAALNELDTEKAKNNHASSGSTYGLASATLYGHAMASSATPLVAGDPVPGTDNGKFAREGHVHPVQTSVTGNAGTANKVNHTLTVNGVAYDGSVTKTVTFTETPHGQQLFTSSGTFTVSAGVTTVYVSGCGGGGGGGGADEGAYGGGGGGGACALKTPITVVPERAYTITIGNGGTAGAATPTNGGAGGASSFGSLFTLAAGGGGGLGNATIGNGGASGGSYATSGRTFCTAYGVMCPPVGGSGLFGVGGLHAQSGNYNLAGLAGSGFGSGGGGAIAQSSPSSAGGAGTQGFLLIEW